MQITVGMIDNLKTMTPEEQMKVLEERLDLMNHLEGKDYGERRRLANETLETYAPLAGQLGHILLQRDLEDLSVKFGYPEEYWELKRLIAEKEAKSLQVFDSFKVPICALLNNLGIEYKFIYRMKSVYSTWHKMYTEGKSFDEIWDLFATRIIYKIPKEVKPLTKIGYANYDLHPTPLPLDIFDPEILECWRIYTAITAVYHVQPGRIKDWVTNPKPNGYQAVHLTVMGPEHTWIEIQIRSERMDYNAEYGNSAHWKYKQGIK